MKSNIQHAYLLGIGVLTWDGEERRSDRYGSVMILDPHAPHAHNAARGATARFMHFVAEDRIIGVSGTLAVEVIEVRESEHVGDLFRGFRPGGAVVGETLTLGHGKLFKNAWGSSMGVEPADGRDADWLNPKLLYRVHECVVRLTFTPDVP